MLKLMTVIGTRPEIIRLSEVIKKCDCYFDHFLVHTGQNWDYTLNGIFFEDLGLRQPDVYLNVVGDNLGQTIGNIISKSYEIMKNESPDAVLILGDTNSALAAISAKRLHIPIFHMEAGNRCFDENLPEETNRRIVDHISDVNMCYTEHARRYLNAEGVKKERTFVTGSPMAEVLTANSERIEKSDILSRLSLKKDEFILLSAHREENIDNEKNFMNLMDSVNMLAEQYKMPIIYSTHPRSEKMIKKHGIAFSDYVKSMKPFSFSEYNCLQKNAFCVVSDSGTLPEEAAFYGFPAVCIRTSTERPEALEQGCFILAGITGNEVIEAVETSVKMRKNSPITNTVYDYSYTNVSDKAVSIIQSYTSIIKRKVWGEAD